MQFYLNGCNEYYIGQTGNKFRNRKTVHEQIRDSPTRQMSVSTHIDNCYSQNSLNSVYKFQISDNSTRVAKERYFIDVFYQKLNTF